MTQEIPEVGDYIRLDNPQHRDNGMRGRVIRVQADTVTVRWNDNTVRKVKLSDLGDPVEK
jgi:hypothetical protein